MSDTETPQTVDELQAKMEYGWKALIAALKQFDESELTAVDPESGWSIKDHLAHLAAWESGVVEVLHSRNRAKGMGLTDEEWRELKLDQINNTIYERNKERSLSETMAYLESVHADMVTTVAGMSYDDLLKSYATFQPDEPGDSTGNPIIGWVIGDTYEHYQEHLQYLEGRLSSGD